MDFDKAKAKKWIDEYWTASRNCPICGEDNWLLLDKVWELGEYRALPPAIAMWDDAARRPVSLPVIALMCNVCGYTIFFNAIAVKAVAK